VAFPVGCVLGLLCSSLPAQTFVPDAGISGVVVSGSTFSTGTSMDLSGSVLWQQGTFSGNAGTALNLTFDVNGAPNSYTPNGAVIVLLDTDKNGGYDAGVGLNVSYVTVNETRVSNLIKAYQLVDVSGAALSSFSFTVASDSSMPSALYSAPSASGTSAISISFAALLSDISGAPIPSKTPVAIMTTGTPLAASEKYATYSGPGPSFSTLTVADYYTSGGSLAYGTVLMPEPSTWVGGSLMLLAGVGVVWRRRRAPSATVARD